MTAPAQLATIQPQPAAITPRWWTPKSIDEALKLAEHIAGSSLVPKDYAGKPGNVLVAMQMGAELGLGPLAAMQNIAVINGRPALWGDAMLAVCKAHPGWESIEERYDPKQEGLATCIVKRKGEPEVLSTFSVADAKRAGLWGKQGPWSQYPKRMLQLRARAFALRDAFPDALRGLGSAEEEVDAVQVEVVEVKPARGVAALKAAMAPTVSAPLPTAGDPLAQSIEHDVIAPDAEAPPPEPEANPDHLNRRLDVLLAAAEGKGLGKWLTQQARERYGHNSAMTCSLAEIEELIEAVEGEAGR